MIAITNIHTKSILMQPNPRHKYAVNFKSAAGRMFYKSTVYCGYVRAASLYCDACLLNTHQKWSRECKRDEFGESGEMHEIADPPPACYLIHGSIYSIKAKFVYSKQRVM